MWGRLAGFWRVVTGVGEQWVGLLAKMLALWWVAFHHAPSLTLEMRKRTHKDEARYRRTNTGASRDFVPGSSKFLRPTGLCQPESTFSGDARGLPHAGSEEPE
jgi:hypothetical protein